MQVFYNEFDPIQAAKLRAYCEAGLIPKGTVDERSIATVRADDCAPTSHFFAGIGGWAEALRLADWPADRPVWTGSCPCQPYSVAGKQKGHADERNLWPEMFRLVREQKEPPEVIFGEQVASAEIIGSQLETAFLVAVQKGDYARANKLAKDLVQSSGFHYWPRWIDRVRSDLEGAGYSIRFNILGAHSAGAPHIRQRLFWCATRNKPDASRTKRAGRTDQNRPQSGISLHLADGRSSGNPSDTASARRGRRENAGTDRDDEGAGTRREQPAGNSAACDLSDRDGRRGGSRGRHHAAGESDAFGNRQAGDQSNAVEPRLEGHAGNGRDGNQPGRIGAEAVGPTAARDGAGIATIQHPPGDGREQRGTESGGRGIAGGCGAGGTSQPDRAEFSGQPPAGQQSLYEQNGGPVFWSAFDVLDFRDNRKRRVEPGTFPLAHGLPRSLQSLGPDVQRLAELAGLSKRSLKNAKSFRVHSLRGYGNAIVPQIAAEFIRAFLEDEAETAAQAQREKHE